MTNAREAAFRLLRKWEKDEAYSNLLLERSAVLDTLSQRDRAFATSLVYGVIERRLTLDYELSLYLSKPLAKLPPDAVCIMRLGVYQLLFLDKVPTSAAINESVKLMKAHCAFAAGLCNAVLHKISQHGLVLPPEDDETYLSIKYACPQWLVRQWRVDYGEETARGILESSLAPSVLTIKVNTVKTTADALLSQLHNEGVDAATGPLPDTLALTSLPCKIDQLPSFQQGLFHVQDKASTFCAFAVGAKPGETVFDLCSAPGGKAFTLAQQMQNRGVLRAFDLYSQRVKLISDGAARLGLNVIKATVGDAAKFDSALGLADRVLCDVPCSGLGILRQKPEVKYKDLASLRELPKLQFSILQNAARYVKNGGRLVYSTCALSRAENEDVCRAFLERNAQFTPVPALPMLSDQAFLTLFPHMHDCDGFFIAAFQKEVTA